MLNNLNRPSKAPFYRYYADFVYIVSSVHLYLHFAYACFIRPFLPQHLTKKDMHQANEFDLNHLAKSSRIHKDHLEHFYGPQASFYDQTRSHLLKGREHMLRLCAAYLNQAMPLSSKGWIWIDFGGGTGFNIERMQKYIDLQKAFDAIYVVDLCPSLCAEASRRFSELGWTNVHVICDDASTWSPPLKENQEVMLATCSYSLSMMPLATVYSVVDRMNEIVGPKGILGVVDFFAEDHRTFATNATTVANQFVWYLTRWFWQQWFELDGVHLHPCRREYLLYKANTSGSTLKLYFGRNKWFGLPLVQLPYYLWVGRSYHQDPEKSHLTEWGNGCRVPYPIKTTKQLFSTYLYAFTWEDPAVDLNYLNLQKDDRVLLISSGGCNALEYLASESIQIHAVDLNPYQNHLLELKMSALHCLSASEMWDLFGNGKHPDFSALLDTRLAAHLSQPAYEYWLQHGSIFEKSFYESGGSGLCIRIFHYLIALTGSQEAISKITQASTLEEQYTVYHESIRPTLFQPWIIKLLNNSYFLWNALGVPQKQMEMLLAESSPIDYLMETIDPVVREGGLFKAHSYFWYLTMRLKYSQEAGALTPKYLTSKGSAVLKGRLHQIKIHTTTVVNACHRIVDCPKSPLLTKAIVMDYMDWMDEASVRNELGAISRAMAAKGELYWRSASREPWYNEIIENMGFEVHLIHRRPVQLKTKVLPHMHPLQHFVEKARASNLSFVPEEKECLDRVNMYASFYMGIKL